MAKAAKFMTNPVRALCDRGKLIFTWLPVRMTESPWLVSQPHYAGALL